MLTWGPGRQVSKVDSMVHHGQMAKELQASTICYTDSMRKDIHKEPLVILATALVLTLGGTGYGLYSYKVTIKNLKLADASLREELTISRAEHTAQAEALRADITALQNRSDIFQEILAKLEERNTSFEAKVGQVSTTLGELEKLSKTDPELLRQYSKIYFLNEHYVPVALANIDPKYVYAKDKALQIHASVAPRLTALLDEASGAGLSLKLSSAFRSYGTQAVLKSTYKLTYGAGSANAFSAEQGYSEHQLGTTIDFTTDALKGGLGGFDKTPEYAWLQANAHRYGFVISYPQGNTAYQYEPWHWRFVGVALATNLKNRNMHFYNMDQREIDTYLGNIFD